MRTLRWLAESHQLEMIDQRKLPRQVQFAQLSTTEEIAEAIRNMTVRGAPAIGVAAAYGMAMALIRSGATTIDEQLRILTIAAATLKAARPTAVNLAWAVDTMIASAAKNNDGNLADRLLNFAHAMAEEDVATNQRIADFGQALIHDGDTIVHHCNTGSLATVDYGTALGLIRRAHELGKRVHVLVDETRPRLQGARLTAWELQQLGISYEVIADNMSGYYIRKGDVQLVLFGADRVAANGDVVNKIGSYMLALAAHHNHVPVYSVFPVSTLDMTLTHGDLTPIENRDPAEVLDIRIGAESVMPEGARVRNPAFDITPHELLTGWVTDKGIIYPPFEQNIRKLI